MIDAEAVEALVAEMIEEMAVVASAAVDMAAEEETIEDMMIVVEAIAIAQEIGTGDTVVGMTNVKLLCTFMTPTLDTRISKIKIHQVIVNVFIPNSCKIRNSML